MGLIDEDVSYKKRILRLGKKEKDAKVNLDEWDSKYDDRERTDRGKLGK